MSVDDEINKAAEGEEKKENGGSCKPEHQTERFDDFINLIGLGKWTLLMVSAYICWGLMLPFFSLGSAFMNTNVDHWCKEAIHPTTGQTLGNTTVVWTIRDGEMSRSRCEEYDFGKILYLDNKRNNNDSSQKAVSEMIEFVLPQEWNNITELPKKQCGQWEYDTSTFKSTVAMEFDLVCASAGLSPFFQSFYYFGTTVGEPLLGYLSDKLGRRWVLRRIWPAFVVSAVISVVTTNYSLLLAMRFLLGVGHSAASVAYVMVMESCPTVMRTRFGLGLTNIFALSGIIFGGLAYCFRDWRILNAVCVLPALLHLFYLPLMDESPRWLLQKGRPEEAQKVLERAARWHKKQLPHHQQALNTLHQRHIPAQQSPGTTSPDPKALYPTVMEHVKTWLKDLVSLVQTPVLRKISLVMFGCFALVGLSYWGLSLAGGSFSSDPFLYMVVSSIMEIIGYTWIIPLLVVFGRRTLLVANFAISAGAMFTIVLLPKENVWLIFILAMTGKLFITAAYNLLYLYSVELFPTCVRNRGVNVSSMMARIASITSPFVVTLLASTYSWAPSLVFGSAAAIGALLGLLLPESRDRPMLDTIDQLEQQYGKLTPENNDHRTNVTCVNSNVGFKHDDSVL